MCEATGNISSKNQCIFGSLFEFLAIEIATQLLRCLLKERNGKRERERESEERVQSKCMTTTPKKACTLSSTIGNPGSSEVLNKSVKVFYK
jgi:hypothetical protein